MKTLEQKLNPEHPNAQQQIMNEPVSASEKRIASHSLLEELHGESIDIPVKNKDIGTASIPSSVFNLCNTVIGAGILGFPSAIANTGYIPAIILFVFVAIVTSFSLHLNMISGRTLRPKASYKALCEATAPKLKILVDATIALTTFGVLCAYLIVIGDSLPPVVDQFTSHPFWGGLTNRRVWIIIYYIILILPFIYLRKMDTLKYTSFFAIMCFIYVVGIVVLYAFGIFGLNACSSNTSCNGKIQAFPDGAHILDLFRSLPIFIFAYTCHANTFAIVNELKDCTPSRINQIIVYTIAFCCVLYCTVGYAGYFTYGDQCQSDLLVKYPQDSVSIVIVRIALSIAVAFSYPINVQPCRHCMASLIFNVSNADLELSKMKFILLTTGICGCTIVVAMIVKDLGIVLGIVGATGITTMSFILPGLFYYNINDEEIRNGKWYKCKRNIGVVLICMGVVIVPFSITMQFV